MANCVYIRQITAISDDHYAQATTLIRSIDAIRLITLSPIEYGYIEASNPLQFAINIAKTWIATAPWSDLK
ncbi:hypothetical protein D3C87_1313500 [compost metagenome]